MFYLARYVDTFTVRHQITLKICTHLIAALTDHFKKTWQSITFHGLNQSSYCIWFIYRKTLNWIHLNKRTKNVFQKFNIVILCILKHSLIVRCSNEKLQMYLHRCWKVIAFFNSKWYATLISSRVAIRLVIKKNYLNHKSRKILSKKIPSFKEI